MKRYLLHGVAAGIAGTVASALVLLLLGEQSISDAIAIEQTGGTEPHTEMFSRGVQLFGGVVGILIYGAFVGVVFGVVFAASRHRLGRGTDDQRAWILAGLGFTSVYLVTFLKYPPNPPSVGDPDTISQRTIAYLAMIVISLVTTVLAVRFIAWLRRRETPSHLVGPAALGLWALIIGTALVVLPGSPDAVTAPATLIWRFRLASAGGQLAFWVVLGVAFGWLQVMASGLPVFRRGAGRPRPVDRSRPEG